MCALLVGCSNLKDKSIVAETKVIGLDIEAPSVVNTDMAICSVKMGYIVTRYASAPAGSESSIDSEYNEISIWKLSGTAKSNMTTSNKADK